jgi:type II secretory pathway component PulM
MPLEGHWERQRSELRPREKRILAAVAAIVVVAVIAVVLAVGGGSGARCVSVTTASSTGGATLSRCGAAARDWCRSSAAGSDQFAAALRKSCRRAGYPTG